MDQPDVLCFGDSNTWGYDPRSFLGDRYPQEVRWTDRLAAATGWRVRNGGLNGRSIPAPGVWPGDAKVLTVLLGSNDLLCGASATETAGRMESFLRPLLSRYGAAVLIAPPPLVPGDWVREERLVTESAALAGHYRDLAERMGIAFADAGEWEIEVLFDGVHFSEAGHRAFAEQLRRVLEPLV